MSAVRQPPLVKLHMFPGNDLIAGVEPALGPRGRIGHDAIGVFGAACHKAWEDFPPGILADRMIAQVKAPADLV